MLRYFCNSYYSRIFYLADLQDGARFHLCGYFAIWILYFHLSGLNVVEVAHDIQLQVSRFVSRDLKLVNLFDTWHGK